MSDLTFFEFFAGGGMTRLGLGKEWTCAFANDFDEKKARTYRDNFCDSGELRVTDIRKLSSHDLPGYADLAWASFPCQDLSLAGAGGGLAAERSGSFWPFWHLMTQLVEEHRAPPIIVLENVYGTLTSHRGRDFQSICQALSIGGYRFGALVIDAVHFVPQSRPRLFVVAFRDQVREPSPLVSTGPDGMWHIPGVVQAFEGLAKDLQESWLWWHVPAPKPRPSVFADLIEDEPTGVAWHSATETKHLLHLMSSVNLAKVEEAKKLGRQVVGAIYRRTRPDGSGRSTQRAEVRFDDIAGCLRTPTGGSSRQTILLVEGEKIRSRLLSPREAARLMGLPDNYRLPSNYNAAYHIAGDGVVVPVVKHLARTLLTPLATSIPESSVGNAA
jgi:DNA (cytosine-5)-methyltransferase 1